jgi:hypothetical protein
MKANKYAQWQQLEMLNFKTNEILNVICVVYRVVKALTKCAVRARPDASSVPGSCCYSDPFEAGVKVYLILSF